MAAISGTGRGSAGTVAEQPPGRAGRRAAALGAAAIGGALALTAAAVSPAAAHTGPHSGGHHGRPPAHTRPAVDYVALGDSYTSAPGVPAQVDANCVRSDHNYPSLVAAAQHYRGFTDVSCGGATTVQMWQAQGTNPAQLTAVTRDTDLVTLQIGGNDVGFGSIIATCAGLSVTAPTGSPCKDHYGASGTDQLTVNVLQTAPKIAKVLRAVHRQAPHAKVVVVGYPDLLPDQGPGCFPAVPFAAGDVPYLRSTEKKLNAMLRVEALLGGASYTDTYGPTVGHDMCQAPADRWIEQLTPAPPAAAAHPNAAGERAMAAALTDTLEGRGHRR
ncbi:SGNH/GDSL hydrolase family protein [Streptomyces sp. NPDC021020]|uniref:SGNH/GDSL hydrolase family protein n=1 Tax=Streptomyces sp. NPDC021020 TaxID=3365109 RepID=UPI0037B8AF7B